MGSGPSTRNVVRIALAVAGTALALYLLYLIRSVQQLILLAVFIAFWLGPFVEFLSRWRVPRVVAILTAYLTLFVSLVFILGLVVDLRSPTRSTRASRQLPAGISKLSRERNVPQYDNKYKITLSWKTRHGTAAGSRASRGALRGHGRGVLRSDEARYWSWRWGSFCCATDRGSQTASTGSVAPIRRSGCVGSAIYRSGVPLRRREHRHQRDPGPGCRLHRADSLRRVRGAAGRDGRRC